MVMDNRHRMSSYVSHEQDDPQSSSENGAPDSPFSGDDSRATATAPSPKKRYVQNVYSTSFICL